MANLRDQIENDEVDCMTFLNASRRRRRDRISHKDKDPWRERPRVSSSEELGQFWDHETEKVCREK